MKRAWLVVSVLMVVALAAPAAAQDAAKVDPKHYKVEVDNAQARILRVQYGAHEKSVMHSHPNAVAVFLTDGQVKFTLPGGKTEDMTVKAGEVKWTPAGTHLPENTGDKPLELVLIELTGLPAKAAKVAKPASKK